VLVLAAMIVVAVIALTPWSATSIIDGEQELWIHTLVGVTYRVPFDPQSPLGHLTPVLLPMIAGVLACLLTVGAFRVLPQREEGVGRDRRTR
jgi:hypothetical protein